ncbi:MAG: queuosine salvage family protein [Acidimicrobiales bacterium]|jgi:hypothetical protein|nr:queuosine salvage family protein [Acidimicrobiales bacterium]
MPEPRTSILEAVRGCCADVAARARFVHVVADRIGPYAATLRNAGAEVTDPATNPWSLHHGDRTPEATAALVLALAAVNFGSGYHPVLRKRDGLSGATTVAAGLRAFEQARGGLRATDLRDLDASHAHRVFDQPDDGGDASELVGLLTAGLNDLGRLVQDRYGGSFLALVDDAGHRGARLVEVLDQLPQFHDVSPYGDGEVPFHKRGQLAVADLSRAFDGAGPGRFDDLHRLTAFADNLVPHVLRVDGVLEVDPAVTARIDAGELLAHHSPEEVEIRACGVHAVELLRDALTRQGVTTTSADLDAALWRRGAAPRYKARPRHRSRCTAY